MPGPILIDPKEASAPGIIYVMLSRAPERRNIRIT